MISNVRSLLPVPSLTAQPTSGRGTPYLYQKRMLFLNCDGPISGIRAGRRPQGG